MEEEESCGVWNCYPVHSSYQGERPVSDQCFAEDQCKGILILPFVSFNVFIIFFALCHHSFPFVLKLKFFFFFCSLVGQILG
jgi:hypothetical protein